MVTTRAWNVAGVVAVRETERKYDADGAVELPDPGVLTGYDTGAGPEEFDLVATYYDTEDLRLLRAGISLRRRSGGDDAGWHLKLPAGGDSREELRLPLGRARRPPAKLAELVRVHTRGAPLAPVAELSTHRRRWKLADARGHQVAELVEDHVVARAPDGHAVGEGWREVEVELGEGAAVETLDEIEAVLAGLGLRPARARSKIARALGDRLPADAPRGPRAGGGKSNAGAVLLDYLRAQVEALRRYDPLVRRDAPDAVHQMRVAARRMRSALQAFGRVLDRDRTGALTTELQWLAAEMGPARDGEVLAERLAEIVAELPAELVVGPVVQDLRLHFDRVHTDALAAAVKALNSERYLALHACLDELLDDPPFTDRAGLPAAPELTRSVRRAYRRMETAMAHVETLPAGTERELALHETRKAAKRLRYATEATVPAVGKRAARLQARLRDVQDVLGDHQDTVVARAKLRELGAGASSEQGGGFTYGLMYGIEQARAQDQERALSEVWRRMQARRAIGWLTG